MKNFDKALYEGTLVALGKVLSRYNAFAQGAILRDAGRDLLTYLNKRGFGFDEQSQLDDLSRLIGLFLNNGFADSLEVQPAPRGQNYIWKNLLLLDAYKELQEQTGSPFLSCPLNLCLYYVADKHGKRMVLLDKTFDMDERLTVSNWEVIDAQPDDPNAFDPLVIENARLVELAEARARQLELYAAALKVEKEKAELQAALLEAQSADLLRAREAALDASRAKSGFLAATGHEIRTPLNGILGMAGLLAETPLKPLQREYLAAITGSGETLLRLLNDLLDISKIEAGRMTLSTEDFDLHALLAETVDLLAPLTTGRDLELAALVSPTLPRVLHGDPVRLRQVLLNLLGNAVKFTDSGHILLRAEPYPGPDASLTVRFYVADSGAGIAAADIEQLFAPFVQARSESGRRGTGLGLAISKSLVELMGGTISVQSQPGQGSVFSFTIVCPQSAPNPAPLTPRKRALVVAEKGLRREILYDLSLSAGYLTQTVTPDAPPDLAEPVDLVLIDAPYSAALLARLHALPNAEAARCLIIAQPGGRNPARMQIPGTSFIPMPRHLPALLKSLAPAPILPRILVLDDDPVSNMVLVKVLEKLGHCPHPASSSAQALDAFASAPFDMVFFEPGTPHAAGQDLVTAFRRHQRPGKPATLIAVAAKSIDDDIYRQLAASLDGFLYKPVSVAAVEAELRKWSPASPSAAST